ncbi:MAG: 16S rRNA (adenine(1518)-N(6)/adenine(1519)-N(6))-dimethyltransferase RsmA [bacterium]|nr:16S rRNA (adenine(1518)-N(6)/adenine(1519)-N(6))-dimethyltransferase RsmA [bacterium]
MIKPKKSLGQNWLINPRILDKIISAAEIDKNDTILEVGPGTGNLTKKLAEKAGRVLAIEKDHRLIPVLKETFENYPNIEIIEADVLDTKMPFVIQRASLYNYKIVANIPYYITSNLLRKIFEVWPTPKLIVLTIQKEVAQRIIAKPPHMNLLAFSIQYYADPEIVGYVSKNNFRPVPKVDSAIIRLRPSYHGHHRSCDGSCDGAHGNNKQLFKLIKAGFSGKRKQLASNLSKQFKIPKEKIVEIFEKLNLTPTIRAENLSLEQWHELTKSIIIKG